MTDHSTATANKQPISTIYNDLMSKMRDNIDMSFKQMEEGTTAYFKLITFYSIANFVSFTGIYHKLPQESKETLIKGLNGILEFRAPTFGTRGTPLEVETKQQSQSPVQQQMQQQQMQQQQMQHHTTHHKQEEPKVDV